MPQNRYILAALYNISCMGCKFYIVYLIKKYIFLSLFFFVCLVTRWDGRMRRAFRLPFWEIGGFGPHGFESWSSQTNDLHLSLPNSTLLGYGKDCLAQCQDNVTAWDTRSWCWWPGLTVEKHYKVLIVYAYSLKSVPVLIC